MANKKVEKRIVKGYKIADSVYQKAMKRARKEKKHLSQIIEECVSDYGKGNLPIFGGNYDVTVAIPL